MKKAGRPAQNAVERITITISAESGEKIRQMALEAGVTKSAYCSDVMERYLIGEEKVLIGDIVRLAVQEEMKKGNVEMISEYRKQANRLAHLLARTCLEAIASRVMTAFNMQQVATEEIAVKYYQRAWNIAVGKLKNPSQEMKESLKEIYQGTE